MEGLFDSHEDFMEAESDEPDIEILKETTEGVRSFYAPESEWMKGDLWRKLHDAGIGVYFGGG
jgi:hypothetical protein